MTSRDKRNREARDKESAGGGPGDRAGTQGHGRGRATGINEIVPAETSFLPPSVLVLRHTTPFSLSLSFRPSPPHPSVLRVRACTAFLRYRTKVPYRGRVDEIGALIKLLPGGKAGAHTYVRNFWSFESPLDLSFRRFFVQVSAFSCEIVGNNNSIVDIFMKGETSTR